MKLGILLTGPIFGLIALGAENGLELFQKAVTLEKASGNLEEAIKLYQRVASEFSVDRALAAKALMREANCYELLGPDEQDRAVSIYEQVTRDFGDQRQPVETAQTKLAALRFEVASVRRQMPNAVGGYPVPQTIGGPGTSDPGHIRYVNYGLNWLLQTAYDVKDYQLSEPTSLNSAESTFVIEATLRPGATKAQLRWMLQNLLADRFKLTLHRETRDLQRYELVFLKKGPKLRESLKDPASDELKPAPARRPMALKKESLKDRGSEEPLPQARLGGTPDFYGLLTEKDGFLRLPSRLPVPPVNGRCLIWSSAPPIFHLVGGGEPIAGLLACLSKQSGRPVVDKTGLTGNWDYNLEFASGAGPANPPGGPSDPAPDLITAVRDQLGLKMESKKGPVEILVIDHIEKIPTEN